MSHTVRRICGVSLKIRGEKNGRVSDGRANNTAAGGGSGRPQEGPRRRPLRGSGHDHPGTVAYPKVF